MEVHVRFRGAKQDFYPGFSNFFFYILSCLYIKRKRHIHLTNFQFLPQNLFIGDYFSLQRLRYNFCNDSKC